MRYFTADWHLGEPQAPNTHSYLRPYPNTEFLKNLKGIDKLTKDDTLYFLGDVAYNLEGLKEFAEFRKTLPCETFLILGDKETDNKLFSYGQGMKILFECFDQIYEYYDLDFLFGKAHLTHKPVDGFDSGTNVIHGHIHRTYGVQKREGKSYINVGVDCWNMQIVPEHLIEHQHRAVLEFYDENCFVYKP